MLVEGEQRSHGVRVERLEHDGGGRPVAVEAPVRFGRVLAGHQRGRLRQRVLGRRARIGGGHQEIAGHQVRALVQHLMKCVLAVGARRAPDHRHGAVVHRLPVAIHALAVRFHLQLLQVGRQFAQRFGVGQHGMRPGVEEIRIPDAQQRQQHRHVGGERRSKEMRVHGARAGEQVLEPVHADGDGHGQSHRRPDRIAPADPVPQREAAFWCNAEAGRGLDVRGDGGEMLFHRGLASQPFGEPGPGEIGVAQGLDGGEGLGGDDEQCRFRLRLR